VLIHPGVSVELACEAPPQYLCPSSTHHHLHAAPPPTASPQHARMAVLDGYRQGRHHVLVATDVAARGLDIRTIRTVVNYDAARDIETHIHR
jgi:hypothetical protein